MAEKERKREAGFGEDKGVFSGGDSPKGKAAAEKMGKKSRSAHQPRDADATSGHYVQKLEDKADEKRSSRTKHGDPDAGVQRKRRQGRQFREKDSAVQGEDKADAGGRVQTGFSQEQGQFSEDASGEPEAEEFQDSHTRKDTRHKDGVKGHYRRRQSRRYQKGERQKEKWQNGGRQKEGHPDREHQKKKRQRGEYQKGECQDGERRDKADQEKAEKSGGHKETADTGHSFQADASAFTESTENVFVGSKKLDRMQRRAEQAGRRTERARKKLPKRREYSLERVFDEKEGRAKYVLTVVKKEKLFKPDSRVKAAVGKAAREPVNFAHRKIAEVEKENSAVEGAHRTEQKIGDAYRYARKRHRGRHQRQREKVAELEKKQFKKEASFHCRKFLEENPEMPEKTLKKQLQKRLQKQRIKREYAKARRAGQAAKNTKEAAVKSANFTTAAAKKLQETAARHASILVAAGTSALLLIMIMTSISSCGAMFSDGMGTTLAGAYMSAPAEIDAVELAFSKMEMELQKQVNSVETDYPGYDEYHYSLDAIGHDPFVLVSYLSAVHTEFTAAGVQAEVEGLFGGMYDFALTPREETRTRTVTKTGTRTATDPVTGMETEEEYEYEEEEEYTVDILEVTLTAASLGTVVSGRMDGEQQEAYVLYNETHGLVQQFYSPLGLPWNGLVSSYYGYRIHPISGAEQLHRGVDIAVPTGTAVHAAMDGTVTAAAYDSSYGNYVVIEDDGGYCTKYAHMDTLGVSAGQTVAHGDVIGTTGNMGNSTGSHLHIECMYNGEYYNPLFYFCGE